MGDKAKLNAIIKRLDYLIAKEDLPNQTDIPNGWHRSHRASRIDAYKRLRRWIKKL